jgi:prepilin signal peptidase PulO-like enzyme (type II secretory pathway)
MPIAIAAIFFASVAVVAVQLSRAACAGESPAPNGPAAGKPPYALLVVGCAVLGGLLVYAGATAIQLGIAALVLFTLVAAWCSDTLCGLVLDIFTLPPLAALLLFAISERQWMMVVAAAVAFAPFAVAAMLSRGMGMGWGDAKLVAITGAALGLPLAVLALAAACAAAAILHRLLRGKGSPIAFAPYIAAATALALPLTLGSP